PIADAEISVRDDRSVDEDPAPSNSGFYGTTRSAADGRFHVGGVLNDRAAMLEVKAARHVDGSYRILVSAGVIDPRPVVVPVSPAGRLVGVVSGPDGAGIEGARVYVLAAADRSSLAHNLLEDDGSFHSGDGIAYRPAYKAMSLKGGAYAIDGLPLDEEYVAVA